MYIRDTLVSHDATDCCMIGCSFTSLLVILFCRSSRKCKGKRVSYRLCNTQVTITQYNTAHIWAAAWQNQQNYLCSQQRLRSPWVSARSDQSLCSALNRLLRAHCFSMWTAKTLIRLIGLRYAQRSFCWFAMRRLIYEYTNIKNHSKTIKLHAKRNIVRSLFICGY